MIMVDFNGEEQIIASEHLYQWDTGQVISISFDNFNGYNDVMVHFANKYSEKALVVNPYLQETSSETHRLSLIVAIPNSLLENATPIVAYVHHSRGQEVQETIKMVTILVEPRKKPEDYISEQEYTYTLEALRAEVRKWLDELDSEREADYQNFKNQIKQDIQNLVDDSKSEITDYAYLTNNSVRFNHKTYSVTKDENTGLISAITDSEGHTFNPIYNEGITDVDLHNSVFWAVAMCNKFGNSNSNLEPVIELLFNDNLENTGTGDYTITLAKNSETILYGTGRNGKKCYSATNYSSININNVSNLLLSNFTIVFWTKINSNGLSKYPYWRRFVYWNDHNSYRGCEIAPNSNTTATTNKVTMVLESNIKGSTINTPINDDNWHSIVIKQSGNNIILTVDNTESIHCNNFLLTSPTDYMSLSSINYSLNGYIDSFRVYDKALNDDEIQKVLNLT